MATSKAFPLPNYTQAPNDFFEMIPQMGEAELRVTLVMIRYTFGFHRNGFKMGVSKLATAAGLSRQGALDGAEEAEKRGTFRRTNPDSNTEAEWELVVALNPVDTPLNPVEGDPQPSGGLSGVKESIKQKENVLSEEDYRKANQKVDAILSFAKKGLGVWRGRDWFNDNVLHYADWYYNKTGQIPSPKTKKSWIKAFGEWQDEQLGVEDLEEARVARLKWKPVIADPNELTKDAAAFKAQRSIAPKPESRPTGTGFYA